MMIAISEKLLYFICANIAEIIAQQDNPKNIGHLTVLVGTGSALSRLFCYAKA
ncbi:MAG: hypothetical protein ACI3V0_04055 [Faecousia sp.]